MIDKNNVTWLEIGWSYHCGSGCWPGLGMSLGGFGPRLGVFLWADITVGLQCLLGVLWCCRTARSVLPGSFFSLHCILYSCPGLNDILKVTRKNSASQDSALSLPCSAYSSPQTGNEANAQKEVFNGGLQNKIT